MQHALEALVREVPGQAALTKEGLVFKLYRIMLRSRIARLSGWRVVGTLLPVARASDRVGDLTMRIMAPLAAAMKVAEDDLPAKR